MITLQQDLQGRTRLIYFFLLQMSLDVVLNQMHYIIPEESKHGTFVGRIAQDLGLDLGEINSRALRIISKDEKEYFQLNLQNGILFVKETIDRELLCLGIQHCIISLQVIVDKPVQIYRVDVEIKDINDNSPAFSSSVNNLVISEVKPAGSRYPLKGAADPDLGTNSITNYEISTSDFFTLDFQKYLNQIRSLELVLRKSLDREAQSVHNLTLTAYDGGKPRLSGTTQIVITVEDFNDNSPLFDQPFYQVSVNENSLQGTLVFRLNATDSDQGKNGEILYKFSNLVASEASKAFSLDQFTGEIRVKGELDFEKINMYEIQIDAIDHGDVQMVGHCKVLVTVLDVNDNSPEITLMSLSLPVPEDAPKGTIVAIISVHDKDSGSNGKVNCHISEHSPFRISPAFMGDFSLTVDAPLNREIKDEYYITVIVNDEGLPSLSNSRTMRIVIGDVNDNAPQFHQAFDTIFIKENNPPGSHIYTASASDPDFGQNSFITYSVIESTINGIPISSYVSINPENGKVFALVSFDHEHIIYFQCHIQAIDAGLHPLSSNITLNIFIEDVNDNTPTFTQLFSSLPIKIPRSAKLGHQVLNVRAVDLDSGYNALLSYNFKDLAIRSPFIISQHTGDISLKRSLTDTDNEEHRLTIVAYDHGEPSMAAVTEIVISLVESGEEILYNNQESISGMEEFSEVNIYLVVVICIISSIFLITLIVFTVLRWQKYRDEVAELKENYKVCSNTGGSWMYSQHTQYRLSSNFSQPKNDLIVFTPNNAQILNNEEQVNQQGTLQNSLYQPKHPNPDWRYSASLKAAMQGAVHMEGAAVLRGTAVGLEQQWPTVSSATPEPEGGEVSPPVGAGVNCNSWTFKYGPGNPKQPVPQIPPDFPENFIIPGSPAIISIRQDQPSAQAHKSNFITFGKKEETKKKKKKKKGKNQEKANNNAADNNDQ